MGVGVKIKGGLRQPLSHLRNASEFVQAYMCIYALLNFKCVVNSAVSNCIFNFLHTDNTLQNICGIIGRLNVWRFAQM